MTHCTGRSTQITIHCAEYITFQHTSSNNFKPENWEETYGAGSSRTWSSADRRECGRSEESVPWARTWRWDRQCWGCTQEATCWGLTPGSPSTPGICTKWMMLVCECYSDKTLRFAQHCVRWYTCTCCHMSKCSRTKLSSSCIPIHGFRIGTANHLPSTHKGVNWRSKDITNAQQQRPESPTVTLTWHACKYKVHKLHQTYSNYHHFSTVWYP